MGFYHFEMLLSTLSTVSFGKETYYSMSELLSRLKDIGADKIEIENAIITPYYVDSGARAELDLLELTTAVVETHSPIEVYLRKRTGVEDLSQIPPSTISKLKHCYLEALSEDPYLSGNTLAKYFSYVLFEEGLKGEVIAELQPFDPLKVYFSYLSIGETGRRQTNY